MLEDRLRAAYGRTKWSLILRGLLGIVVGVYIFTRPVASVAVFAMVIALWALFDGITNIARAFMLRGAVRHWGAILAIGILGVLFGGAALYYYPALSLAFAVTWVALWLIAGGAMGIYVAMQERSHEMAWGWTMTLGVLSVLAGIVAYASPGITLLTLMSLIGAFAIISGIMMLVAAFRLTSAKHRVEELARDVREPERRGQSDDSRIDRGGSRAA